MAKKDNGKKNNFLSGYVAPSAAKKKAESNKQSASSNAQKQKTTGGTPKRVSDPVSSRIQNSTQKVRQAQQNNQAQAQHRVQTGTNNAQNNQQNSQQMRNTFTQGYTAPNAQRKSVTEVQKENQQKVAERKKDRQDTGNRFLTDAKKVGTDNYSRTAELTAGAAKQWVGGMASAIGHDSNEYNEYKKNLDQAVKDGKITQKESEDMLARYEKTDRRAKKYKDWEDSKQHKTYQKLADWGEKVNKSGDKQIEKAKEGLGKGGKLLADAYTSGIGMAGDMATGPAWAATMLTRTMGNELNSTKDMVDKGVITEKEAERNAAAQGWKEVGTEFIFKGAGLTKKLKGVGKATEAFDNALGGAIDKLTSRISNDLLRDVAYGTLKGAGGMAEEATEELIGGLFDAPITNAAYANNVDARNRNAYRENLIMGSTDLQKQIDYLTAQGYDRDSIIDSYAGQIADDKYKSEIAAMYMENGFSEKQANKIASGMQDYMLASLSGDKKAITEAEDKIVNRLGKYTSLSQSFSASETANAMASAALMVGATGMAGGVSSQAMGSAYRQELEARVGKANAVNAVLNTAIDLDDTKIAARSQAMKDNGGNLSNLQWYELGEAITKQEEKDYRNAATSSLVAAQRVRQARYFAAPNMAVDAEGNIARDENGNIQYSNEVTNYRATQIRGAVSQAMNQSPELVDRMDEDEQREVAESIEKIALGFADMESVNNLTLSHPEARAIYEQVTGEKLKGTNEKTRDYLYQQSIKNYEESARIATVDSVDTRKGELDVQYSNAFGGEGQAVFSELSSNVDLESPENYVQFASVAGTIYDFGRTGASMDEVLAYAETQDMSREDAQKLYEAGVQDAENSGYTVTYDISDNAKGKIKNSDRSVFMELARLFGVNIRITDNLEAAKNRQANGMYDAETNILYLNFNDAITKNVGYTITHELTHRIKEYDSDAFDTFAKAYKDAWIAKNGQESYDAAIKERVDRYAAAGKKLSKDGALEEIIADQMGEILHDRDFILNFAMDHTEETKTILDAIRDVLRKITQLFGLNGGFRSDYNEALLSQFDMLKDAEQLFAESLSTARSQQTQEMLEQQSGMKPFDFSKSDAVRNIKAVANMNPVSELTGDEFSKGEADLVTQVSDYFNSIGNNAYNDLIGDVELVRDGVKSDIGHGIGRKKAISFMAVPNVITKGKVIDARFNWKGRGKDTVVISAPIKIGNEDYYMAVVVERNKNANTQRFYVHEVFLHQKNTGKSFKTFSAKDGKGGFPAIFRILSLVDEVKSSNYSESEISELISTDEGKFSLDSEGRQLTQQQEEYFQDSKVRDENGQLLVVYHGTDAEFDVFKNTGSGHYFTANPKYAERYGSNVRAFYLNIVKPFDVTQDSVRDDFVQFVRDGYSNSLHPTTSIADIYKAIENGIDWTEADNLIEWIEENELDYDGLVIDEGGDLDENGEVFDRGNSYVSFNSNQAKLTSNENPTENGSVKFSMDAPYEETKDLVAVHNVKESDIAGLLKLKGIPMPSIAVIKAAQGHDMYGEYSFIFGKDTIDPAKNKANKVYGGDAWTPVFPTVEYEVKDDKAFDAFRKKIADLTSGTRQEFRDTLYGLDYTDMFNYKLRSNNGLEKFKEALLEDTRMMQVFLNTKGQHVDTIVKKEETTMSPAEIEKYKIIIDKLGEDIVRASVPDKSSGIKIGDYRREYLEKNSEAIKQAYKAYGMEIIGLPEDVVDQTIEGMNRFELFKIPRTALQYLDEGPTKVKETPDYRGTEDAIREKTDKAEYKKWLDDLFDGLTIQEGLYNGKDYYTASGNRRSFNATHMEVNLENIVKAMKLHENGETMLGHSFKAVAQKKYDSIADIKSDSKRLEKMSEEEYSEKNKEFADRESKIIDRFFDDVKLGAYDNPFIIRDTINSVLVESIRNAKSSDDVLKELKDYPYTKNATKADADAIWQLVEDVANMPTGYFEAKPERAVTFDEVQAVIAPDNAPSEIVDGLKEQNVDVVTYEAGNEEDRKDKLNSLNNVMFSLDAAKVDVSKHKTVKLSKKDYAIVYHSVVAKNASIGNSNEHLIDYTFTDNLFVMYETWGDDSFRVFLKKAIVGNEDRIEVVTNAIKQNRSDIDRVIESVRNRRRRDSRNNADASGRGAGETDGRLDRQESNSIEVSDSNAGSGAVDERVELTPVVAEDAVVKYSISKHDDFTSFVDDCLEGDTSDEAQARRQKVRDEIAAMVANITRKDTQLTHGKVLNRDSVKKQVKELVFGLMASSENTYKEKNGQYKYAMDCADIAWKKFKNGDADLVDFIVNLSRDVVEETKFVDDEMYQAYLDLRQYLRANKISAPAYLHNDINWESYRKKNFGRMRLTTELGHGIDGKWFEIAPLIQPFVDATQYTADGSEYLEDVEDITQMFFALEDALDNTKAYRDAYADEFAQDLEAQFARDFCQIVFKEGEAWKSFADKKKEYYETRINEQKARHKLAMRELREQRDKKLEQAEQKRKDDLAKQKAKYEEREEMRKAAEREKKAEQKAKKQDHRARMKAFGHIENNYNWLTKRLLNPKKEDGMNIPEGFRTSLATVLAEFDLQSERSKALEEKTGKVSNPTQALRKLRDELKEVSKEDESGIFVYNGALFSMMDNLINSLEGHSLRDLNTEDLTNIDDMLASIKHMIQHENKLFAEGKKQAASSAGNAIIKEAKDKMERYGRRYDRRGDLGKLDTLLNESMMTPMNFFKSLGGQMEDMYKNLRRGQDDYIRKVAELREIFGELFEPYKNTGIMKHAKKGSALEEWQSDKQAQTFKLASGEEVTMSVAQMMSLYCLSKREQAMQHILGNGIVMSDIKMSKAMDKVSGKIDRTASSARMTYDDVVKITDALTDEQKEVAQKLQELMNGKLQEWGNETSMQMYGIRLFKEENYFPIESSNSYLPGEIGKASGIKGNKITSFGFTKPLTEGANNPIVIGDIFDIVTDHANKMALYSAYAAPLTDFNRVMNYVQRDDESGLVNASVKQTLQDAYSSGAITFIDNFLDDINGSANTRMDGVSDILDKSIALSKKAAIGANARVLVQQPTAIVRAFYYINPIYFANPSEFNLKQNVKEMHEHCPIAAWKAWGNYQNDFTRGLQDIIMNNESSMFEVATMGIYGLADDMTWGMIWGAVKNEVKAKHPNVEYGSEEFWTLCNERASLVFDETQVVDSVFHRSDAMRSKNSMTKVATAFMAEPTRTYNMLRSSLVSAYRMSKDGDVLGAGKEMTKVVVVLAANAAAVSAAAAVVDAIRGRGGDDDDWWELWYKNFISNFIDNANPFSQIVFVKDVSQMMFNGFKKNILGDKDTYVYTPTNMALDGWYKMADGMGDVKAFLAGGSLTDFLTGKFMAGLGQVTGIPLKTMGAGFKRFIEKSGISVFADDGITDYSNSDSDSDSGIKTDVSDEKDGLFRTAVEKRQRHINNLAKNYSKAKNDDAMLERATEGYRQLVESGDFSELSARRTAFEKAGGDVAGFDDKVHSSVSSAYKKTIGKDSKYDDQQKMKDWMLSNGWTEAEVSDVAYRSETGKKFKEACRMLDADAAVDALVPLLEAGLTEQDIYKLWNNRNRGNFDTSSTGKYVWGAEGTITSGFGYRGYVTAGASSYHQGIDIGAAMGTKVVATDGGTVTYTGYDPDGYGNYIIVTHDNGMESYYGHLSAIGVKQGQRVSQSQAIGNVGSTGCSTGPHLHFAMKINGQFVDPSKYVNQ